MWLKIWAAERIWSYICPVQLPATQNNSAGGGCADRHTGLYSYLMDWKFRIKLMHILVTFPFAAELTGSNLKERGPQGIGRNERHQVTWYLQSPAQDKRWGQTTKSLFHLISTTSLMSAPAGEHWFKHTVCGDCSQTTTHNRPSELFTVRNHDSSLKLIFLD